MLEDERLLLNRVVIRQNEALLVAHILAPPREFVERARTAIAIVGQRSYARPLCRRGFTENRRECCRQLLRVVAEEVADRIQNI